MATERPSTAAADNDVDETERPQRGQKAKSAESSKPQPEHGIE
jgi:hypothetical protein